MARLVLLVNLCLFQYVVSKSVLSMPFADWNCKVRPVNFVLSLPYKDGALEDVSVALLLCSV
jgi:hypothetical protein